MGKHQSSYIIDANVLIDYAEANLSILTLFSENVGRIIIPDEVLEKVEQLDIGVCDRAGLKLIEPTIGQYFEAGRSRSGLAFDDHLCMIIARDNHWICITNDRALRAACDGCGVSIVWGLEIMLPLVEKNILSSSEAENVATRIHSINPKFVHENILAQFNEKIKSIVKNMEKKPRGLHSKKS